MKTSMTRTRIIIAGAVVLLVGSICQAQNRSPRPDRDFAAGPSERGPRGPMADRDAGPGRGRARDHGPRLPILRALSRLDVTEEQHVQIRTVLDDNAAGMEAAREALNEAMAALHDATLNEADDATLQAAATQVGIAPDRRPAPTSPWSRTSRASSPRSSSTPWRNSKRRETPDRLDADPVTEWDSPHAVPNTTTSIALPIIVRDADRKDVQEDAFQWETRPRCPTVTWVSS